MWQNSPLTFQIILRTFRGGDFTPHIPLYFSSHVIRAPSPSKRRVASLSMKWPRTRSCLLSDWCNCYWAWFLPQDFHAGRMQLSRSIYLLFVSMEPHRGGWKTTAVLLICYVKSLKSILSRLYVVHYQYSCFCCKQGGTRWQFKLIVTLSQDVSARLDMHAHVVALSRPSVTLAHFSLHLDAPCVTAAHQVIKETPVPPRALNKQHTNT